ncbi:MAG: orotidine-5'-phosphate decarboxylase, partial [Legionella sp.]
MHPKLIVALDFDDRKEALKLVDQLNPLQCALKIGSELFTRFGTDLVRYCIDKQFKVFLDLKFHDIPNTVAKACTAGADLGVWMMNVHAAGGARMMEAASVALSSYGKDKPLLIAVTVLTSFSEEELASVGVKTPIMEQVPHLARLAKESGLDGVVSSAHEVPLIKQSCGQQFITVTPGIRLPSDAKNDQTRVMTPAEALKIGSDYLVVGRSITKAADPAQIVDEIISIM